MTRVRAALISDVNWRQAVVLARKRGADLICLAHLSFAPYVAARRDRGGLEHAERAPSGKLREAVELAAGGWIAASAYESEGEGVFYVTAYLAGPATTVASTRQRNIEADHGRYEQMFWSPGHHPPVVAQLPWGDTVSLVGADLRSPAAWATAAAAGASHVIGGASEPAELWRRTRLVVAGMAACHALTALVANRGDDGLAGGGAAFGPDGTALQPGDGGLYVV